MHENKSVDTNITFQGKIALIIFGLFLTLTILELGLRIGGFIFLSLQETRNRISAYKKGAYRIMCLGESTTAHQYPAILEEILNQRNIGIKFSVIDKGICSKTPAILEQLEFNLNQYKPDMVISMIGINDRGPHVPYEPVSDSKVILLLRSFRTYKLTRLLWLHIVTKAKGMEFYKFTKDKRVTEGLQLNKSPVKIKHGNDNEYVELGLHYKKEGKFFQAEKSFREALCLNPKNGNAYFYLGWLYSDYGKVSLAEGAFKKAIEINPKNDKAYEGLGNIYTGLVKYTQAEDVFKKAIEINPKNDNAYFELGVCYKEQEKVSQAEESFKKACELNPENGKACLDYELKLIKEQSKIPQLKGSLKEAIERNPEDDRLWGALSTLCSEIGKHKFSEEYYKKANELRSKYYCPMTVNNYRKLKEILDKRGIQLVCVQYPVRSVEPLKKIFDGQGKVIFVDNEKIFKEALNKGEYNEYFVDMFGGDFGHCTPKGNKLLAENIANVILRECFNK